MIFKPALIAILLLASHLSFAEIAVIVHPENTQSFKASDVKKIFLGKIKSFSNGGKIEPINLPESIGERHKFESSILKKNPKQMKTYWSKIIFTGKGSPPVEKSNEDALKKSVSENPNSIGYITKEKVDDSVKVVLIF